MSEADQAEPAERPNYWLHAGLFAATCATTWLAGGVAFAATLMSILLVHEMGHYVAARLHRVDASLPYFIPLPPYVSLGTLGAVIRMRKPIEDRNALIDVGAAGPLAGLVVAIPLLIIGVWLSPVGQPTDPNTMQEGNSIAYLLLKLAVTGRMLPADDGTDIDLHPMAFAAWVGLLVTMINLIPIGQLDGGHVARAYLGNKHERFSRVLHVGLLIMGIGGGLALGANALRLGHDVSTAASQALAGGLPWLVWAAMIALMRRSTGGAYHPPVGDQQLTRGRRWLALATALVFLLIFTPVPLRPVLGVP
jgi:membrane-associated protease RseP (regulator of RpoE activity)